MDPIIINIVIIISMSTIVVIIVMKNLVFIKTQTADCVLYTPAIIPEVDLLFQVIDHQIVVIFTLVPQFPIIILLLSADQDLLNDHELIIRTDSDGQNWMTVPFPAHLDPCPIFGESSFILPHQFLNPPGYQALKLPGLSFSSYE
jgi:hypothetical protein